MTVAFLDKLIDPKKSIFATLTSVFGLNVASAIFVIEYFGFTASLKIWDIEEEVLEKVETLVQKLYFIEDEIKKLNKESLAAILESNNLRAMRHNLKLPVNGQRTHTNAKTRKDKKDSRKKGRSVQSNVKKSK